MVHEGRAALCGRPFPVAGRFPCHPVGEGLAPPAGFRNFSGQRWNFALWDGAPGRRALRAAWSAEGGRVRRPAPTGQFLSLRNQTGPLKRRRGGPLWPPVPGCGTFPRHPVGEGLAPPAGFRNFSGQRWNFALWDGAPGRRALRAAWSAEGGRVRRPAPTGQFLSLRNQTGPLKRRRGGPLWPPVPGCGTFPRHPVGEGLAPPAGFRNFSGQRWNFALRDGAPGRRALRAAWSAEGGWVRRPAPTTSQANHSKTDSGRPHGAAPTG